MNIPTNNALIALLHGASDPKNHFVAGIKVIHIGPDKLPTSIFDTTPLTGHVWEKSASFDSLVNAMSSQRLSHTIPNLIIIVSNDLPIDTTTLFMEASKVKKNIIRNVLNIHNLIGTSFLQSNGNTAKVPQSLDLKDRSTSMAYVQFIYVLDTTMVDTRILQPHATFQFYLKLL